MARAVQSSGRTGWYFRVKREGVVRAGMPLSLIARPQPLLSLAHVHQTLYVKTLDRPALTTLANAPELTDSWRALARRRLSSGQVESWAERLGEDGAS
jgi:MOSC domain-containing protein YiiM